MMLGFFKRADQIISFVARGMASIALAVIFLMFLANVLVRFVPIYNFTETDDWIQICLIWMIFLGAQELVRTRSHFVVDVLTERLSGTSVGRLSRVAVTLIECVMYTVICWYGWVWVLRSQAYFQSIPWLQVRWAYAALPVSAFFMSLYSLRDVVEAVTNLMAGRKAVTYVSDRQGGF